MTISPAPAPQPRSYTALWRAVPGSAVYLIGVFVLAIAAVAVLAPLFWAGVGLLVLVIGLPIVLAALFVARGFGVADRYLLRLTGLPQIAEPNWRRDAPAATSTGFWATLVRPIRNGHYWLSLLHGMIVNPIVSTITFGLTVAWLSGSLGGLTYWIWGPFIPNDADGIWGDNVAEAMPWVFGGWTPEAVQIVLYLLGGAILAVTLPWVLGGLAGVHHAIARGLLGRWRSDDLVAEARAEASARGAAVHAEDAALRRLERDIHDGPQQRLVRLQMDLAALERRAEAGDPAAASQLAREAREQARLALDELRALSSGVAPPLLQDRGLASALAALAATSPVTVAVEIDPALDDTVAPEVARSAYFIAAELLTNVAKHSGATAATLAARLRPGAPRTLDVWVVDNGHGGAHFSPAHGLEGLRDRVHGLRGTLSVQSPMGGPTTIGAHLPALADGPTADALVS